MSEDEIDQAEMELEEAKKNKSADLNPIFEATRRYQRTKLSSLTVQEQKDLFDWLNYVS